MYRVAKREDQGLSGLTLQSFSVFSVQPCSVAANLLSSDMACHAAAFCAMLPVLLLDDQEVSQVCKTNDCLLPIMAPLKAPGCQFGTSHVPWNGGM